jgi:hypothetical protein
MNFSLRKTKFTFTIFIRLSLLILIFVLSSYAPLSATMFHWSGSPIAGETGKEYPTFFPEVSAEFKIHDFTSTMTLTLTYIGASEIMASINQTLTGFLWDITDPDVRLTALLAKVADSSSLVNDIDNVIPGSTYLDTGDLSGQWAFRDDISAGFSALGPLGAFGVGTMGSINFNADVFGSHHVIDSGKTEVNPAIGGVDFGIIHPDSVGAIEFSKGGFQQQGPMVQNAMVFTFGIIHDSGGTLTEDEIANVQPLFGSEGAPLVPEPSTFALFGIGILGVIAYGWRRRRKFREQK